MASSTQSLSNPASSPASSTSHEVVIKVTLDGVTRRLPPLTAAPSWAFVLDTIASRFSLMRDSQTTGGTGTDGLELSFRDEEGDEITISSDVELQELWGSLLKTSTKGLSARVQFAKNRQAGGAANRQNVASPLLVDLIDDVETVSSPRMGHSINYVPMDGGSSSSGEKIPVYAVPAMSLSGSGSGFGAVSVSVPGPLTGQGHFRRGSDHGSVHGSISAGGGGSAHGSDYERPRQHPALQFDSKAAVSQNRQPPQTSQFSVPSHAPLSPVQQSHQRQQQQRVPPPLSHPKAVPGFAPSLIAHFNSPCLDVSQEIPHPDQENRSQPPQGEQQSDASQSPHLGGWEAPSPWLMRFSMPGLASSSCAPTSIAGGGSGGQGENETENENESEYPDSRPATQLPRTTSSPYVSAMPPPSQRNPVEAMMSLGQHFVNLVRWIRRAVSANGNGNGPLLDQRTMTELFYLVETVSVLASAVPELELSNEDRDDWAYGLYEIMDKVAKGPPGILEELPPLAPAYHESVYGVFPEDVARDREMDGDRDGDRDGNVDHERMDSPTVPRAPRERTLSRFSSSMTGSGLFGSSSFVSSSPRKFGPGPGPGPVPSPAIAPGSGSEHIVGASSEPQTMVHPGLRSSRSRLPRSSLSQTLPLGDERSDDEDDDGDGDDSRPRLTSHSLAQAEAEADRHSSHGSDQTHTPSPPPPPMADLLPSPHQQLSALPVSPDPTERSSLIAQQGSVASLSTRAPSPLGASSRSFHGPGNLIAAMAVRNAASRVDQIRREEEVRPQGGDRETDRGHGHGHRVSVDSESNDRARTHQRSSFSQSQEGGYDYERDAQDSHLPPRDDGDLRPDLQPYKPRQWKPNFDLLVKSEDRGHEDYRHLHRRNNSNASEEEIVGEGGRRIGGALRRQWQRDQNQLSPILSDGSFDSSSSQPRPSGSQASFTRRSQQLEGNVAAAAEPEGHNASGVEGPSKRQSQPDTSEKARVEGSKHGRQGSDQNERGESDRHSQAMRPAQSGRKEPRSQQHSRSHCSSAESDGSHNSLSIPRTNQASSSSVPLHQNDQAVRQQDLDPSRNRNRQTGVLSPMSKSGANSVGTAASFESRFSDFDASGAHVPRSTDYGGERGGSSMSSAGGIFSPRSEPSLEFWVESSSSETMSSGSGSGSASGAGKGKGKVSSTGGSSGSGSGGGVGVVGGERGRKDKGRASLEGRLAEGYQESRWAGSSQFQGPDATVHQAQATSFSDVQSSVNNPLHGGVPPQASGSQKGQQQQPPTTGLTGTGGMLRQPDPPGQSNSKEPNQSGSSARSVSGSLNSSPPFISGGGGGGRGAGGRGDRASDSGSGSGIGADRTG